MKWTGTLIHLVIGQNSKYYLLYRMSKDDQKTLYEKMEFHSSVDRERFILISRSISSIICQIRSASDVVNIQKVGAELLPTIEAICMSENVSYNIVSH